MRLSPRILVPVLVPFLTSTAAQILERLSFGQHQFNTEIPGVPNWAVSGDGHLPYTHSDRIVLTPAHPGNKRGALWADTHLDRDEWIISLEFRVTGPERGNGNMQLWLVRDKSPGYDSIYTVDRFDGLAVVLDQYGGGGGMIRAFLNEGSTSYRGRQHHEVDELAFGHCDYSYRNLGRFSKLTLSQGPEGFEVDIDGNKCFSSKQIRLPKDYFLGVSAASAENPDTFELHKLTVSDIDTGFHNAPPAEEHRQQHVNADPQQIQQHPMGHAAPQGQNPPHGQGQAPASGGNYDELARHLQQSLNNIDVVYRELKAVDEKLQQRHEELKTMIKFDQLNMMSRRLEHVESMVTDLKKDIEGNDYRQMLANLNNALENTQRTILTSLPDSMSKIVSSSAPSMTFFILVIIGFQGALAGAYVYYKRRRANSPKKFL